MRVEELVPDKLWKEIRPLLPPPKPAASCLLRETRRHS